MSDTTTTSSRPLSMFTIALDDNGKIIWTTESESLLAGTFYSNAKDVRTIIIGENVSSISAVAFTNLENISNIYVYNDVSKNLVYQSFNNYGKVDTTGNLINHAGKRVDLKVVEYQNYINEILTITSGEVFKTKGNTINVSEFGAKGDGITDDTAAINRAIDYVTNNGGKLLFNGDSTYIISSPIKVCPKDKSTNNPVIHNFDIDFNNCRVEVAYDDNGIPEFNFPTGLSDAMIYVDVGFINEERIGIIQNVQLYPGIYYDTVTDGYSSGVHTGMYLASSSQISYKNIKILDATRGVYISGEDTCEVFMDNIQISKSRTGATSVLDFPKCVDEATHQKISAEISADYSNTENVGIDCRASDCHFSNIVVIDYLVGMRILNGDNRVYGAHIWNTYCPNQYKYSVGFINSDTNYYTNCVVDHFHIGWLSYRSTPFYLTNCHWLNKEVDVNNQVYGNESFAFYIGEKCGSYSGGGIYANDCHMVGSDLDNKECFTNFCNVKDNDIHYSGEIVNVFGAPIPGMKKYKYSENNIHDCENNSKINQYGKVKSVEKSTNDIVKIGDKLLSFNSNTAEFLNLGSSDYGYMKDDVVCITFKYNIQGVSGEAGTASSFSVKYFDGLSDYFGIADNRNENIPFTSSTDGMFAVYLKVIDQTMNTKVYIERSNSNATINISELRMIKIPNDWKFPKYYLESEKKYKSRILGFFKSKQYSENQITVTASSEKNLAYMTLPFKYSIKEYSKDYNPSTYILRYSKLGRPCFVKANESSGSSFSPALQMNYNIGEHTRLYCIKNCMYMETEDVPNLFKFVLNDHVYWNYEVIPNENTRYSYDFVVQNCDYDTTIELPIFEEKTLIVANMINNPYGYHFESPIDSEFSNRAILAPFGNEDLVFKKGTYEFTLHKNNSLLLDFEELDPIDGSVTTENSTTTDNVYEIVSKTYSESGNINAVEETYGLNDGESIVISFDEDSTIFIRNGESSYKVTELTKAYNPVDALVPLYANGEIRLMMKNTEYSTDLATVLINVEYSNL